MKTDISKRMIILIICVVTILFVGCSKSGISMKYVKTPDKIYLTGDLHRQEIIELNKKYEETKDYNEKQKILQEIAQLEVIMGLHILIQMLCIISITQKTL